MIEIKRDSNTFELKETLRFLDNQPVICVQQLDANHLLVGVDNYNKF